MYLLRPTYLLIQISKNSYRQAHRHLQKDNQSDLYLCKFNSVHKPTQTYTHAGTHTHDIAKIQYSLITENYIAPLPGYYPEELPIRVRLKRTIWVKRNLRGMTVDPNGIRIPEDFLPAAE